MQPPRAARLQARARELVYTPIVFDTTDHAAATIKLYQAEGYHETGRCQVGDVSRILPQISCSDTLGGGSADAVQDGRGTGISG